MDCASTDLPDPFNPVRHLIAAFTSDFDGKLVPIVVDAWNYIVRTRSEFLTAGGDAEVVDRRAGRYFMCATMFSPNSLHLISVAPSISRAKS